MTTTNQLVRKRRKPQRRKSRSRILEKRPQLHGVCMAVYIMNPKKPNSAERKVARIRMSNGAEITALIGGEGHHIQEHSRVLVRGGRVPDLPGVRYHVIRGALDCSPPHSVEAHEGIRDTGHRRQARSKYGQKYESPPDKG